MSPCRLSLTGPSHHLCQRLEDRGVAARAARVEDQARRRSALDLGGQPFFDLAADVARLDSEPVRVAAGAGRGGTGPDGAERRHRPESAEAEGDTAGTGTETTAPNGESEDTGTAPATSTATSTGPCPGPAATTMSESCDPDDAGATTEAVRPAEDEVAEAPPAEAATAGSDPQQLDRLRRKQCGGHAGRRRRAARARRANRDERGRRRTNGSHTGRRPRQARARRAARRRRRRSCHPPSWCFAEPPRRAGQGQRAAAPRQSSRSGRRLGAPPRRPTAPSQ